MLLKRTNVPYSHDRCLTVMTQLLSVRGASQPLTPKSKKFFFMCIIAASRSISNWDAHHGSIGEMFVTWWNWHNCFPRHSSVHSHLWEVCHKELWNYQSNHWWKWKPRNDVWDTGTVDFGLVNYVIYFHPKLILVMILFFTSLQMVCLDEIGNYAEIVSICCMACTDLDCRKYDTGYPRANVSICSKRKKEQGRHDGRWLVSSRYWRSAFAEIFRISHGGSTKCAQQPSNGPQKNGYYAPDFPEKIAKNCLPLSLLWPSVMPGKCTMQVFTFSWWVCGIAN